MDALVLSFVLIKIFVVSFMEFIYFLLKKKKVNLRGERQTLKCHNSWDWAKLKLWPERNSIQAS